MTPACKSKLPVLAMSQGACFLDVLNICSKGIPPANLMLEINCLQKNKELLSFNCRKLVQYHNSVKNKVITNLQFFANACAVEAKTCGGWKTLAQRQCIINLNKQNKTTATCKQGIQTFLKSLGSK